MTTSPVHLLLADDDIDDCLFFKEALEEIPVPTHLTIANNGVQLMDMLSEKGARLPDALFLDLNMPRKSGFDCLSEIKNNSALMHLRVIIYSTSLNKNVLDILYHKGAHYYIRKPGEFDQLKSIISAAVHLISENNTTQPSRDKFILQP